MQPFIKVSLAVLFVFNIVHFTVALRSCFTKPNGVAGAMRLLVVAGAVGTVIDLFILMHTTVGAGLALASLCLFISSHLLFRLAVKATFDRKLSLAFSNDSPMFLNRRGVYSYVRHPFYVAYTLNWTGVVVGSAHIVALLILFLMIGFYVIAAVHEEQKFRRSTFSSEYAFYRRSVGMFFPRIKRKQTTKI